MSENYTIYNDIIVPEGEAKSFNFAEPVTGPVHLSNSLQMTVHSKNLIALSAPQIGIKTRVFYIRGFESAMFNAKIVDTSDSEVTMEEISPSYEGLVIKVKRPEIIRVRWTDALGETRTDIFTGLTSRTIQRKIDYLDGISFIDKASKYHREAAIKKWNKWKKINVSSEKVSMLQRPHES